MPVAASTGWSSSGTARVTLDGVDHDLAVGDAIDIPLGAAHRVTNPDADELVFVEVQLGDYFGEDDIVRLGRLRTRRRLTQPAHHDTRGEPMDFELSPKAQELQDRGCSTFMDEPRLPGRAGRTGIRWASPATPTTTRQ